MAKQKTTWEPANDDKALKYTAKATAKITTEDDTKVDVGFTKVKLNASVKDPVEALKILGLKGSKAIKALVKGANALARAGARKQYSMIRDYAEAKNMSFEAARTKLDL